MVSRWLLHHFFAEELLDTHIDILADADRLGGGNVRSHAARALAQQVDEHLLRVAAFGKVDFLVSAGLQPVHAITNIAESVLLVLQDVGEVADALRAEVVRDDLHTLLIT